LLTFIIMANAQEQDRETEITKRLQEEARKPKEVAFIRDTRGIVLDCLLNNKTKATLVLDTGATYVMIRKNIAEKLGIDVYNLPINQTLSLANGQQVAGKYFILDSVKINGIEAKNIEAVVLLDEDIDLGFSDGLLGISFLERFNFQIDYKNNKLILNKLH